MASRFDTFECECSGFSSKILIPIKVSNTRILYKCFICDGIVCWSDSEDGLNCVLDEEKENEKVRPPVTEYNDKVLKEMA